MLSMWPSTVKSDEEKSQYTSLAQENSLAPACVCSVC
jgi:hypothetical protein